MIVVTGVGAVTALGPSARETFERVLSGERGFRELSLFDPGEVRARLVAEVVGLRAPSEAGVGAFRSVSRTGELAAMAAREAVADAGLDLRTRRVGLVLGGTTTGMLETEPLLATLLSTQREDGSEARRGALSRMLAHPLSAPTDQLVAELGPFCRARSLSSACSSGANALIVGALWLELGLVDAVLCGGADALCRVTVTGFNALGVLDPDGAKPFDVRRRGLTLGEGAGMVVLERSGDAGARATCALLGWASRAEAHHITNPEPTGAAPFEAMRAALERAGLTPRDIDYVNAHGTGTPLNDSMETRALARLFGDDLARVPVSSQKGMIGHTLAASGAVEAVITALAIERGVLPPTGGLSEPDPECALRHVMRAESRPIGAAISTSFGFGGMDTALVLGRADRAHRSPRTTRSVFITGMSAVTPAGIFVGRDVANLPSRTTDARTVDLPSSALDLERARRLDRASRLAAVACEAALGAHDGAPRASAVDRTGVVLGVAFGAVDATAEFMRRLRDKGPRMVRPADFPSLVPSATAGYVSIYLRLGGPTLLVADLAASGECAVAQAFELVASGEAARVCAGAVEERSVIVEEVFSVLFGGARDGARGEGSAAVALASAEAGVAPLARLREVLVWRMADASDAARALAELSAPPPGAVVVLGIATTETDAIVLGSTWAACPRYVCSGASGAHEASGAFAVAASAAKVARGDAPAALFVGSARGWGYAGTVWPPDDGG